MYSHMHVHKSISISMRLWFMHIIVSISMRAFACTFVHTQVGDFLCAYSCLLNVTLAAYHIYLHHTGADKVTLSKQSIRPVDGDILVYH